MESKTPNDVRRLGDDPVFPAGTIVFAHYLIESCLGRGSTTTLYKCRDKRAPETVLVLKVLRSSLANDEKAAARFEKEVLALADIKHEHVIRSYGLVRDEGSLAYIMEYAGGGDLCRLITDRGALPLEQTLNVAAQICAGLVAIHAAGIVHRDLKPQNILFDAKQQVKIADFGIAKTTAGKKVTQHGEVLGAVDFVSPEYLQTGEVDARSDIYAWGLIVYEMLTGSPPFKSSNVMESLMKRIKYDPPPPRSIRGDVPLGLDQIVMKALRRNPAERFQSAAEVLESLNQVEIVDYLPPAEPEDKIPLTQRRSDSASRKRPEREGKHRESGPVPPLPIEDPGAPLSRMAVLLLLLLVAAVGAYQLYRLNAREGIEEEAPLLVAAKEDAAEEPAAPAKAPAAAIEGELDFSTKEPIPAGPTEQRLPKLGSEAAGDARVEPEHRAEPSEALKNAADIPPFAPVAKTLAQSKPGVPAQNRVEEAAAKKAGIEAEQTPPRQERLEPKRPAVPPPKPPRTYTVVRGDTISGIAVRHRVSPEKLMELNGVDDPLLLPVGKVLVIPERE